MACKAFDVRSMLAACLALVFFALGSCADEPKPADAPAATEKGAAASDDDKPKVDRYEVPKDAGVDELLEFVRQLRAYRPPLREEAIVHQRMVLPATRQALTLAREIAKDEHRSRDDFKDAMDLLLMIEVRSAQLGPPEKLDLAIDELRQALKNNPNPSEHLVTAARATASHFEYSKQPERAVQLYSEFGDLLAKCENEKTVLTGKKMQGAARRLNLVGRPLELSGTLMDGSTFDWNSYRGKVVLVDFWATWCGPCLREIPNVKSNYDLYHDKGFEVVGISLDDDRSALEEFLKKDPKPWVTLHDGPWDDNKVATYYGIMGIPTVILVDKEGKVVSTYARGAELGRLLEQQLGPVDLKGAEEKPADAAGAEKKTAE